MKNKSIFSIPFLFFFLFGTFTYGQKLKLNDLEYFETQGLNVFVYSNQYNGMFFDEKTAGIELIHHGVRTSTGGAIRLQNTPEQWDLVPQMLDRKVDKTKNTIEVTLEYKDFDFRSKLSVMPKDDGFVISVILDKPVPKALEGSAGFNMEFLPSSYFEKTYFADGSSAVFPLYPASSTEMQPSSKRIPQFGGYTTFDDRGKKEFIVPKPLATAKTFVLAPEDPERFVKIQSENEIMLFDGRNLAQNGWFILRSLIPAGKTGKVLEWFVKPNAIANWVRTPNIGFSQVGYMPNQEKVAVIELDTKDVPQKKASLWKIADDGQVTEKYIGDVKVFGKYLRYNYVKFDFTQVKEPGIYFIKYGEQKTNTFRIAKDIYSGISNPTNDVWLPVQMDHMKVNEAYRVWHGAPYADDALQAPLNVNHFDNYQMGSSTETKYKPLERIPGLNVGGWFDAGDFDIETPALCRVISELAVAWEEFALDRDETFIDQEHHFVDIHRPDGKPDVLQQLEHGALNLCAQIRAIGHPARGINVPNLHQYHHLGDASTITDGLPYNPNLKPYETDGKSSGTMDDRWVFTNRMTWLDYSAITSLAEANRSLKNFNKELSEECLKFAEKLWAEEDSMKKDNDKFGKAFRSSLQVSSSLELYISTKNEMYANRFKELIFPALDKALAWSISVALRAYPYMDNDYKIKLKDYVVKYKMYNDTLVTQNPYGVPMANRNWGGNGNIINWASTNYFANKYYPEIINSEAVYKGLNFILGCHPYSNVSFVATVGTRSKKITYGNNRADFRFIAGGIVPGLILLKPDYLENKDDWPFFWGENECVEDTGASWIFLSGAVNEMVKKGK